MPIRRRLRAALSALQLTRADAERQRDLATLTRWAAELEANGLKGPLSVEIDQWAPYLRWASPGHFYSPIPRLDEIHRDADRVWAARETLAGIDLGLDRQRALVARIADAVRDDPLPMERTPERRYYADNFAFGIGDATVLQGLLKLHRPRRIVELGSGFSSALMLDVIDGDRLDCSVTFVDPHAELLRSLLRDGDLERHTLIEQRTQDLPLDGVRSLRRDDVLFIDSTHVVRTGSDVCRIVFEILPELSPGVLVHVHDIFWPFEMTRVWVEEGRQWGECYLMRAFLMNNPDWEIVLFNHYLGCFERALLQERLPQFLGNPGGSLWLRRVSQ